LFIFKKFGENTTSYYFDLMMVFYFKLTCSKHNIKLLWAFMMVIH